VLLLAVVLLGVNLRTVIASLPPLLPTIRQSLGLSSLLAGLLTTLPVACFGALALAAPVLARRIALERLLLACLALTAAAASLRGVGGVAGLFAGSVLSGVAVGVAQAVLPILLRTRHGAAVGVLTGAYSTALTLGATLAAGVAVPLAGAFAGSWRASLATWALPAAVAALAWIPAATRAPALLRAPPPAPLRRERRAWAVAGYFGCQSMAFYAGLTWLPAILQSRGWSPSAAGWLLALASLVSALPAFLVPAVAGRRAGQRPLLAGVALTSATGVAGLMALPALAPLWMALVGGGQGGALGLGLILPVLRGRRPELVASLTAMTLSFGYLLAALGPWLLGAVHSIAGNWTAGLVVLLAMTLLQLAPGAVATRAGTLHGGRHASAGIP
jgi:CP family cyanate transporter-like MFS transporter